MPLETPPFTADALDTLATVGQRRAALDGYLDAFNDAVDNLSEGMRSGSISLGSWQTQMRQEIKDLHINALVTSYGGDRSAISFAEWGRVGGHLRVQYQYLQRYAEGVQSSAMGAIMDTGKFWSEKYISYRSRLYGGASRATFYRGLAMGMLPQVPGDGNTQCLTNCKCELVFEEGDQPGLMFVYWELRPAEHCDDCVQLSHDWSPYDLWLPVSFDRGAGKPALNMVAEWVLWLPRMVVT